MNGESPVIIDYSVDSRSGCPSDPSFHGNDPSLRRFPITELMMTLPSKLDPFDRKILVELSADARLPFAELARRIGLSPSAATERVKQLESLGLIRGYRADLDLKALGLSITAFIRMTCDGPRYRPFLKFLATLDPVQECHHLTGGDAFLLKVVLTSTEELERLIEKLLPYGMPTTSMVLSTPVDRKQATHLLRSL